MAVRYTEEELDEMAKIPILPEERRERRSRGERLSREEIFDFMWSEGAAAVVRTDGRNDFGTVDAAVNGYAMEKRMWETDAPPPITELIVAAEHYNRIMRILEKSRSRRISSEASRLIITLLLRFPVQIWLTNWFCWAVIFSLNLSGPVRRITLRVRLLPWKRYAFSRQ
jgi:hypothetical protein